TVPRVMSVTVGTPKTGDTISLSVTPNGAMAVSLSYVVTGPDPQTVAVPRADAINGNIALTTAKYAADTPIAGSFTLRFATPPQSVTANVSGAGATTTVKFAGPTASRPLTAFRWPVPGGVPA